MKLAFLTFVFLLPATAQEWPAYGGDSGETHYSRLALIHRGNVRNLKQAWEWKTGEVPLPEFKTTPGAFEVTPIMLGGVLYFSTPYNRVIALDSVTGRELWSYDPKAYVDGQVPNGTGFVHRGVAAWRDSKSGRLRILMNSRARLISLDAETGKPVADFGDNGIVNLVAGLRWETDPKQYTNTSPPVVYKDLIIVGNGVADRLVFKKDPPGDVRAFDAHTGKLVWTFFTVPRSGEFGSETWGAGSEKFTGHTNVWAPITLDAERGLLYLPVSTPSNDFYGGARPGQNLFGDSLVCLDAATGKRKWHFQLVHHGLWDYDLPGPPVLATIHVNGKKIEAVVQLTKTGWAFVFDRLTGKPVWPIEERPVPASDVPGEHAWPTQPFPTKPPPFAEQGVSLDDAFDLTPELKAEAQAAMRKLRLGPIFTPPSLQGTLMRPSIIGGANWGGGALDPETGILYVKSSNSPSVVKVKEAPDVGYAMTDAGAAIERNIPLTKPPYAHLTAIDLNKGEIAWQVPFGDDPRLRANSALAGVKLPDRLGATGAMGAIVTKGGVIFVGGGDTALHAVDASNGNDLWSFPLGRRTSSTPMTYEVQGKQYVVIASGAGRDATLTAFALAQIPDLPAAKGAALHFEVASIKRNTACGNNRRPEVPPSPGRLNLECATLKQLVEQAYGVFADGVSLNPRVPEITGAPAWAESETYDIAVRAEDGTPVARMAGPMMQTLLEDRFQLKLHRATKENAVYFLTVAKNGAKLEPTKDGSCVAVDLNHMPADSGPGHPQPVYCGYQKISNNGRSITVTGSGITMGRLAASGVLTRFAERPIVDKTGLAGSFDIHLEFTPDRMPGAATAAQTADLAGPSLFDALGRLGLKLEPGKASVEILVIDRVERPSEN